MANVLFISYYCVLEFNLRKLQSRTFNGQISLVDVCTFNLRAEISFLSRASASQHCSGRGRRQGHSCAAPFQAVTGASLPWLNKDTALVHGIAITRSRGEPVLK